MIKKILFSICVLFSFFLLFLFSFDKINILAYSDVGNPLGSYPVKLDIEQYDNENVLYYNNQVITRCGGTTANLTQNGITINGNVTGANCIYFISLNKEIVNGTYYVSFYDFANGSIGDIFFDFYSNSSYVTGVYYTEGIRNFNVPINSIAIGVNGGTTYNNFSFKFMVSKGTERPEYYSSSFKFGYNVHYSAILKNNSNSSISSNISILLNGNLVKSGNCTISANSTGTLCTNLDSPLYLPFQIDDNGNISFSYNLQLNVSPIGNLSFSENDSGLALIPVFSAYYRGEETNYLYFKESYTFNNLFLSGFNVNVNSTILSNVAFATTNYDDSFVISSNENYNIYSNKLIKTGLYNYINFIDYLDIGGRELYYFVIPVAVPNVNVSNNRIYSINISNLSLRVIGDIGVNSPLPGDTNILEKYNSCSAWYDIPCQLGNAITYVIYEAPIISPVLTFIVSFITMFSSLVSFVDLFKSLGIVFGCFIIYMFIELLHKYSK